MEVRYKHINILLKLINNNNGNIHIVHTTILLKNYSLTLQRNTFFLKIKNHYKCVERRSSSTLICLLTTYI